MSHGVSQSLLQVENKRLQAKIQGLQRQLLEKDDIITSLEAQVRALIKSDRGQDKNDVGSAGRNGGRKKVSSKNDAPTNGLPPRDNRKSKGRRMIEEDQDNQQDIVLPRGGEFRQLSLNNSIKAPVRRLHGSDVSERCVGTDPSESTIEMPGEEKDEADSSGIEIRQKSLSSAKGAIKALPRELSIRNSDDDDITKYSVDDKSMPTYYLESGEMRDAYNARGLYTGHVLRKQQMPHGKGCMKYHLQGRSYDGDWVLGHWHGKGRIQNSNGEIYEGPVTNDLRVGFGKLCYPDGRVFFGNFLQDDPVEGTLTFPDGARYIGELHNGTRHGYGKYFFTDGSIYEGQSSMNVFEGNGRMTWPDGGWYEGEWMAGEIHGQGKEIRPDGSLRHEGQWSNGVPIRM